MWKNLRKGRVFRFWRIIDLFLFLIVFFIEILEKYFILPFVVLFLLYYYGKNSLYAKNL